MNVTVLQVQIVIFECPCAKACRVQTPPDHLAERLRKEMCYGQDSNRESVNLPGVTIDMATAFHNCPIRN